jgi:hypothetical protein
MIGWIKLHRKIIDNPLWTAEPFDKARAWIDLLIIANYEPSYIIVRGIRVDILRGQVGWSEPRLAARWQWSRSKLRRYLQHLEIEQQIKVSKSNVTQIITILNYTEYQSERTAKEQQTIQQKNPNKEDKEIKEDIYAPEFLDFYNQNRGNMAKCIKLTDERKKLVLARIGEYDIDHVKETVTRAGMSDFLSGKINGFKGNFDWIFKKANYLKITEGNYDNTTSAKNEQPQRAKINDL